VRTAVFFLLAASLPAASTLEPRDLRCEYRVNPEGLDTPTPRLTWTLAPAAPGLRGLHQQAYRVLVASTEAALRANRGDLWDSGRVPSSQSVLVPYAGKPVAPGAAAFWKVQVWDQAGAESGWSAPAHWSRGLDRWTAQ
jgi:alpha-L-rhamnosidase